MSYPSVSQILLALTLAVAAFAGLINLEERSAAAREREVLGFTRGAMLDRTGRVLAASRDVDGRAVRHYSVADAEHLLGYQDSKGRWHGLEARYQSMLSGSRPGSALGAFFRHLSGASTRGDNVRLTIDSNIQRVAATALGKNPGAVVALNPSTGAVLAMVSSPVCTSGQLASAHPASNCLHQPGKPIVNRATHALFSPGSTFKIVTLSAALDSGRFTLNDVFSGADVFGPSPYFDNSTYPSNVTRSDLTSLTMEQALAFSDNFTFAHIGLTLGAPTLLSYARRFWIGRRIPFDSPVAVSRAAGGTGNPSLSQLAQASFGSPVDEVTPMQMAMIASAVANRGRLMAPHLLADSETSNGQVISRVRPRSLGRVVKASTAQRVATAMQFVVDYGSGLRARIPGVAVAGKTGTAASGGAYPHAWFISFAPVRHPVVAVAVLREFSGEGFEYAAPIARKVMVAALHALRTTPQKRKP